jgi:uncharacterized pyridoxamine 5'-phosphate oxidase family protein
LATVEDDQPRVRAMGFWFADETGFYFQTGAIKELSKQILKNPKVEVCFYKHEGMTGTMLRIAGSVEILDDIKLKEKVFKDRPFLRSLGLSMEKPGLVMFKISHGQAHFWTMATNLKPKEIISF